MGGISCVTCQPVPATITDAESRWLVVDMGIWNQPDDFVHRGPVVAATATETITAVDQHHVAPEPDPRLLDVFQDVASIHGLPIKREWSTEERSLVAWWMDLTTPGSQSLTATASRLTGQRLSRWCVVRDGRRMIERLRMDCESGADSPREPHGCLLYELRGLKEWLGGQNDQNALESVLDAQNDLDLSDIDIF